MSDLLAKPELSDSKDCPALKLKHQKINTLKAKIGEDLIIRRALPTAEKRMIGAWCFLDHFGPLDLKQSGLDIAPHPHMGLQTFTWTLQGEILHRDSLGYQQIIHPGEVNLMTAGDGIAHSEESLPDSVLHGVQLWIALPDAVRMMPADFKHYETIPTVLHDNVLISILAGDLFKKYSPVKIYSPLCGYDLSAKQNTEIKLPLNPKYEYGILPLIGHVETDNEKIEIGTLLYLDCGQTEISLKLPESARILIVGGEPFKEEILLWWNFVGRTKEEIAKAAKSWNNHKRFGEVRSYPRDKRLVAPIIPLDS